VAKLTAAKRKEIPKSSFGIPAKKGADGKNKAGKGGYPMPDKKHAADAKARASAAVNAGRMSKSQESKIDAKANRKLYGSSKAPKGRK
jgi:hypothetical protein